MPDQESVTKTLDPIGFVNARLDVIETLLLLSLRKEERRELVKRYQEDTCQTKDPISLAIADRLGAALTLAERLEKELRYPSHQGQ